MALEEAGANVCTHDIDYDFLIKCNLGDLKLCEHGKCVCIGGQHPHANKAPNSAMVLEEAGANLCSRDIDCDFLIKCNPGGLKICDHVKRVCIGGHHPHADKAPNSAMALEEASANVCSRDIDCDFLIKCNPDNLKLYDHGKCVYVGGHRPHANQAPNSVVALEEVGPNVCSCLIAHVLVAKPALLPVHEDHSNAVFFCVQLNLECHLPNNNVVGHPSLHLLLSNE
ncbi:hypothetical protein FF1_033678 [Malus domestica]